MVIELSQFCILNITFQPMFSKNVDIRACTVVFPPQGPDDGEKCRNVEEITKTPGLLQSCGKNIRNNYAINPGDLSTADFSKFLGYRPGIQYGVRQDPLTR